MAAESKKSSVLTIIILVLASEAIFILPFVLIRIFRPTFLEVFQINNTQLGSCFSIYGVVALFSYLFGGPLADKYHPRKLISVALILTAIGGFYFSTYPSLLNLQILYGVWGFTTIFLFWASMIKATRIWGGKNKQGIAFGFLDGGRGLTAALFGSLGVLIFSLFIPTEIELANFAERQHAFKQVILVISCLVMFIGFLVFFLLKSLDNSGASNTETVINISAFKRLIKFRSIWLLMIIILCAYYGYKMTDVFSLYAKDVMLFNDLDSAKIGTYLLYLRPFIGVSIGLLADRTRASLWIIIGFLIMLLSSVVFSFNIIDENAMLLFSVSIIAIAVGVYSTRVLYFATLEEAKIPVALTGTAVGLISIVGYTPDIFAGPLMGYLLDSSPGITGHKHVFMVTAAFSFIGFVAAFLFFKYNKKSD